MKVAEDGGAVPDAQEVPPVAPGRAAEIKRAAARIFREKGYEATSIQDIADAVGILKGSLYYYIDTKEDLLFDVIRGAHEQGLRDVRVWMHSDAPPSERLRLAIEGHVTSNLQNIAAVAVFFQDFRSLGPERRTQIVADRDFYDANLRELVKMGQEAGEFSADAEPKLVVMAMLGMMNWVYQWYREDGPLTPQEIARSFADLVLGGLAVRAANDALPDAPTTAVTPETDHAG